MTDTECPPAPKPAKFLTRANAPMLAYRLHQGHKDGPCFVWLGGYASDMLGSKAEAINAWAVAQNASCLRFDYRGHGESEGAFEEGCISLWRDDAQEILTTIAPEGPLILIGSSMGAWIACHMINSLKQRIRGLIAIAPAPDFVTELFWPSLDAAAQSRLMGEGRLCFPSDYDDSEMIYTRRLVEDGRECRVLDKDIILNGPAHILQGTDDRAVPWSHAKKLADRLIAPEVTLTLIKGGDHRLSGAADIDRLCRTLALFIPPVSQ